MGRALVPRSVRAVRVQDAGVMDMAHVIGGLIEDGEFPQIFRRLDDE